MVRGFNKMIYAQEYITDHSVSIALCEVGDNGEWLWQSYAKYPTMIEADIATAQLLSNRGQDIKDVKWIGVREFEKLRGGK
jgi:hypothetical protein